MALKSQDIYIFRLLLDSFQDNKIMACKQSVLIQDASFTGNVAIVKLESWNFRFFESLGLA